MTKYNKYIDHTNLKQDALPEDIKKLCEEAKEYDFASVCVNPSYVSLCSKLLKDTDVKVCTVIGFPLGTTTTIAKAQETIQAVKDGADEVDMVIHAGMLKSGDLEYTTRDIKGVVDASGKAIVKVILETCLLNDAQIVDACHCAMKAGADFVKTSTGFSTGGATVHDVRLMKETVGDMMKVKAAGGIHSFDEMKALIEAGADRVGASAGVKIMKEMNK